MQEFLKHRKVVKGFWQVGNLPVVVKNICSMALKQEEMAAVAARAEVI